MTKSPPAGSPASLPAPPAARAPRLATAHRAGLAVALGCACAWTAATAQELDGPGALDRPVVPAADAGVDAPATVADELPGTVESPEALQAEVRAEQDALETLPRDELERRADDGERAAQVVLGADFAKEADLLGFAPAAANDALADAARWYSTAAAQGFPGAPSLDQAGVRFWPVRIRRETRP